MDLREYFQETSLVKEAPKFLVGILKDLEDLTMPDTDEAMKVIIESILDFFDTFNEVSEVYDISLILNKPYAELEEKVLNFLRYLDTDFEYVRLACEDARKEDMKGLLSILFKAYFIWMREVENFCIFYYKQRRSKNILL